MIDPQTGKRIGSYFFRTSDEINQVHDFYEDKMTQATWSVNRAPTQVWGSSDAEGRKFDVSPERRGSKEFRAQAASFEESKAKAPAAAIRGHVLAYLLVQFYTLLLATFLTRTYRAKSAFRERAPRRG